LNPDASHAYRSMKSPRAGIGGIVQGELLKLILDEKGIHAITERLSSLLDKPVAVADAYFHNLAAASPSACDEEPLWTAAVAGGGAPRAILDHPLIGHYFSEVGRIRSCVIIPGFPEQGMSRRRILAPIVAGAEILGYMTVLESSGRLEELDPALLQQATLILAIELLNKRRRVETELRLLGDVLGELLTGGSFDRRSILHRSSLLGIDLLRPWSLLLVGFDWNMDTQVPVDPVSTHQRLFECVRRSTTIRFADVVPVVQGADIVLFCPAADLDREDRLAVIADGIWTDLRWYMPTNSVSVAIGGLCRDLSDFTHRYEDAKKALDLNRSLRGRSRLVRLEDFGISAILYRPDNPGELRRFADGQLSGLLEYDLHHCTELLPTLDCYLAEGASFRPTARKLGVHLNTLRGRLVRIAKVLNRDLKASDVRLGLQVAIEIYRYSGLLPQTGEARRRRRGNQQVETAKVKEEQGMVGLDRTVATAGGRTKPTTVRT